MREFAPGLHYFDLDYLGVPSVIATGLMDGERGVALIDPGPSVSLPALRAALGSRGLGIGDITALLLTHIHLDHAGATGTLVKENPGIAVYVHERGARHMIDPGNCSTARRGSTATRWIGCGGSSCRSRRATCGRSPAANGSTSAPGRLTWSTRPATRRHHVSYFEAASGVAFVGDTAGGRIGSSSFVMPPTPPPDIDLDQWQASADRILAKAPRTLFLTHFGPSPTAPGAHLAELMGRLHRVAGFAKQALTTGGAEHDQAEHFREEMRRELRLHMPEGEAQAYELAIPLDHCFLGLARVLAETRRLTPAPGRRA